MSPENERNIGFIAWFFKWTIIGRIIITTLYIIGGIIFMTIAIHEGNNDPRSKPTIKQIRASQHYPNP